MDVEGSIDDRIVRALVEDGRLTFSELGRIVGLSAHAAAERVRRLVATGVIVGFTAQVDPRARGQLIEALIDVRLAPQTLPGRFEEVVAGIDEIRDSWFVTGRYDYVLRVQCSTAEALDDVVRSVRQRGGVAATETHMVMRHRTGQRAPGSPSD